MKRERIREARNVHRQGDLDGAERIYRDVLAADPEDPDALHLLGVVHYQRGECEKAHDFICRALASREVHPQSHNNLGMVLIELGRHEDALASFRRAIDLHPAYAEAYNNLGTVLKKIGQADKAETAYLRALELDPEYINAWNNLGNLCLNRQQYSQALGFYSRALALDPDYPLSHYNLACALLPLGRLDEAEAALLKVVREDSSHVQAWNSLGRLYCLRFQYDRSIAAFQRSTVICPGSAEGYIGLGNTYSSMNRFRRATLYLEKALAIAPDSVEALKSLGLVNKLNGNHAGALHCLNRARELSPQNAEVLCSLAALYMAQGLFEHSASLCREVIQQHPDCAPAYYQLAQLTPGRESGDLADTMSALLDSPQTTPLRRARLQFALAKLLEEQGRHGQSFACLTEANRTIRRTFTYSLKWHQELVDRICQIYTGKALQRFSGKGYESNVPIFIVGMPRSGSTLVEQILSSHPDIHGGGELSLLVETVTDYLQLASSSEALPADVGLRAEDMSELGKRYVKDLRSLAPEAKRITNKMLANYLHIGIISLILPGAKIIHCRRNPVDTCFSIYKKHFARGHQYAYDLEDIGGYYLVYSRMMEHWHKVMPGRFLEVSCEDLVRDQERQTRRLLAYCDLEWHDGCIRFYENKRPVFTASSVQVRRPVTASAIDLWRKYENGLQPLISVLAPLLKEQKIPTPD